MTNYNYKGLFGAVLLSGIMGGAVAGESDEFTTSMANDTKLSLMIPQDEPDTVASTFNFINKYVNKNKGLDESKLKISGVTRFLTIYRSMDESYLDMINSEKNFSFSDYPIASVGTNTNGGYPLLEINLQSQLAKNFDFNVGYSLAHSFTGNLTEGSSQNLSVRQNLNFKASHRAGMIKSTVYAGEVLWTNLSRFTMGTPEYRDNYFERLPWDWYRKSFTRYQEYFSLSSNIGAEALGRSPLQGFIGVIELLPAQLSLKGLYGRTNRSLALSKSASMFPSFTHGYRLEKVIFERQIRGKAGVNFYQKNAETDFTGGLPDINTIGSFDFLVKVANKVNVSGEFGYGKVENPYFSDSSVIASGDNGEGAGGVLKLEFDKRAVLWPFSVEYFYIQKNLVSLDGGIINSNRGVRDGGFGTEIIYDNTAMMNISNEVGQLANNRSGANIKLEAAVTPDFKVQFSYAISQELQNIGDTITIQHRVNSFSRSRFRPWFQAGGPYARIKSAWLRTFETITIGNEAYDPKARDAVKAVGTENDSITANTQRDLLGFNTIELFLKYKVKIGKKHELVLLNFSSINTVKEGFNAFSNIDDKTYTSLLYNDFTAAFKLTEKISIVGNYAVESFKGSTRTNLSPDKAAEYSTEDPTVLTNSEDRIINQLGSAYALGLDYDVSKTTSLHWRTKYMIHEDKNFTKDKFSGFESNFELKIFF